MNIKDILNQLPDALTYGNIKRIFIEIVETDLAELKSGGRPTISYCDNIYSIPNYLQVCVGIDAKAIPQVIYCAVQLAIDKNALQSIGVNTEKFARAIQLSKS